MAINKIVERNRNCDRHKMRGRECMKKGQDSKDLMGNEYWDRKNRRESSKSATSYANEKN